MGFLNRNGGLNFKMSREKGRGKGEGGLLRDFNSSKNKNQCTLTLFGSPGW